MENRPSAEQGNIAVDLDRSTGIIHVCGIGMWSVEQADAYFETIARIVQPMRSANIVMRALIDLRAAPVQSAVTAQAMGKGAKHVYAPTDRIAFICTSKLYAMQLKRGVKLSNTSIFETEGDALAWLLTDEPGNLC